MDSERITLHKVWAIAEERALAMECGVASFFSSWVNSYANERKEHPNHWGTTHSSVFWQCLGTVLLPLLLLLLSPFSRVQLCDPIDGSPPGSAVPGILQARTLEWSLQIGDQGLVESDLSSWIHLILISLCYALGLYHSFKSCALPSCFLFRAPFLSPLQAHSVASTIFWRDN